jgi:hypothetical protein
MKSALEWRGIMREVYLKLWHWSQSLIERYETMAKKATKKGVVKPAKTPAKVKSPATKNGATAKAPSKKTVDTSKKQPTSKVTPKKVAPSTKSATTMVSKSVPAKKGTSVKAPEKKLKATVSPKNEKVVQEELMEVVDKAPKSKEPKEAAKAISKSPIKKEKPVGELPQQGVEPPSDVEISESMPSKKAKKYEGATEEESKWLELRDKHKNIKPQPYKMTEVFLEKTPIEHKTMGWGFVLSVVNDRLEVLFRSGIKHLISNYKTNI